MRLSAFARGEAIDSFECAGNWPQSIGWNYRRHNHHTSVTLAAHGRCGRSGIVTFASFGVGTPSGVVAKQSTGSLARGGVAEGW